MLLAVGEDALVKDVLVCGPDLAAIHCFRFVLQAGADLAQAACVQGGGEHQGLAVGGAVAGNFQHVLAEAHFQHAVCFVQYQYPQPAEIGAFAFGAASECVGTQGAFTQQLAALLQYLARQLPGGYQHQGQGSGPGGKWPGKQLLQHRQQVGQRFAAAGGRADPQVPASQRQRNNLLLHGGGLCVGQFSQGELQAAVEFQFF